MTLRVLDIETGGMDPDEHDILEIASVDLQKGGGFSNQFSTLVRNTKPIPAAASAVHHILEEDVSDAPHLHEVAPKFCGADVAIAHNADFEKKFFEAHEIEIAPVWICTFKCALRVWPELESHSNQFLRYHLGLATPHGVPRHLIDPHRALSDVLVTSAIMERLMAEASWPDLVTWSQEPALFTRLNFGKHRGQRFDEADPSYLQWILRQPDMDEGVKFSADYWLKHKEQS